MIDKKGRLVATSGTRTVVEKGRLKEVSRLGDRWERSAPPGTVKRAMELVPDRTKG